MYVVELIKMNLLCAASSCKSCQLDFIESPQPCQ